MELYDPILPSITWIYITSILRIISMIAIITTVCAVVVYYSVVLYRIRKNMKKEH